MSMDVCGRMNRLNVGEDDMDTVIEDGRGMGYL